MIKIYACLNSKLEGVEGCVAQTIVEDEGATRSHRWVGYTKGLANPLWSFLSYPSTCWIVDVVQHVGGDLEYVFDMIERSPTLILVHAFIQNETNVETNKGPTR